MKTFCTHSRDNKDSKRSGGTVHADSWGDAAERVAAQHSVAFTITGRPYFVNSKGEEARLYLSILPDLTECGRRAIAREGRRREEEREKAAAAHQQTQGRLEDLINNLGVEKAIALLEADAS